MFDIAAVNLWRIIWALSGQMAAIKPTSVWLELVFSIIMMGHLKLELDGDNKDHVGYM